MNTGWIITIVGAIQALLVFAFQTTFGEKIKQRFNDESEKLKQNFAEQLSTIQSKLERENISHQIQTAEFMKYKFDKIIHLHIILIELFKIQFLYVTEVLESGREISEYFDGFVPTINYTEVDNKIESSKAQLFETSLFIPQILENQIGKYLNFSVNLLRATSNLSNEITGHVIEELRPKPVNIDELKRHLISRASEMRLFSVSLKKNLAQELRGEEITDLHEMEWLK